MLAVPIASSTTLPLGSLIGEALKRTSILAVTLFCVTVSGGKVSAESLPVEKTPSLFKINSILELPLTKSLKNESKPPQAKPKPKKHKVVSGDTLTKIAKQYKTTVTRLYDKNKQIEYQDQLKVGWILTVPEPSEKLKHRRSIQTTGQVVKPHKPAGNSAGNTYSYGYCTWYVKNRRPDIPNSWGNADTWDDYAPGSGYTVGSKPRVGAIGVTKAYMHVVYIEKVKGNQVLVSEMNYQGWNVVSQRWTTANEFNYIY